MYPNPQRIFPNKIITNLLIQNVLFLWNHFIEMLTLKPLYAKYASSGMMWQEEKIFEYLIVQMVVNYILNELLYTCQVVFGIREKMPIVSLYFLDMNVLRCEQILRVNLGI